MVAGLMLAGVIAMAIYSARSVKRRIGEWEAMQDSAGGAG
jgi:hypothetical protein